MAGWIPYFMAPRVRTTVFLCLPLRLGAASLNGLSCPANRLRSVANSWNTLSRKCRILTPRSLSARNAARKVCSFCL